LFTGSIWGEGQAVWGVEEENRAGETAVHCSTEDGAQETPHGRGSFTSLCMVVYHSWLKFFVEFKETLR